MLTEKDKKDLEKIKRLAAISEKKSASRWAKMTDKELSEKAEFGHHLFLQCQSSFGLNN